MEPEEVAAALERSHPGWAVIPGYYSGRFTAIPGASYGRLDSGMIVAADPAELERRMALVDSAAGRPVRRPQRDPVRRDARGSFDPGTGGDNDPNR
ncbi:hypothetical protein [Thermomonospora cellulosilytica]|uniref:Uncharacterized protein n=1 Tax=Thermomonospora cellulosilytica TaxID=1411118 RepID=A0A7W3MWV1_9ACTN|nr:hypothetical protein [Thermomonospora cellulosilytica]MBA9003304.1 hypothetical protein [Thermomonospora cellulosilytica]